MKEHNTHTFHEYTEGNTVGLFFKKKKRRVIDVLKSGRERREKRFYKPQRSREE
jgi:hypothetical protein